MADWAAGSVAVATVAGGDGGGGLSQRDMNSKVSGEPRDNCISLHSNELKLRAGSCISLSGAYERGGSSREHTGHRSIRMKVVKFYLGGGGFGGTGLGGGGLGIQKHIALDRPQKAVFSL